MEVRVPGISSLKHGESRVFTFPGSDKEGFVIRFGEGYKAYVNQCAHWNIPLDFGDGEFYYEEIDRIVCKSHGAAYRVSDGYCDSGPCAGAGLTGLPLQINGDEAVVEIPENHI